MTDVWLITGIPGAGKTTAGQLLARRFDRSVFIEGDLLQGWIASGGVWPGTEPAHEASRQIQLNMTNQCALARSYAEAGFTPVVDYVVVTRADLETYRRRLGDLVLRLVVLHPGRDVVIAREADRDKSRRHKARHGLTIGQHYAYLERPMVEELSGIGLWLDNAALTPDATVEAIMAGADRARVTAAARSMREPRDLPAEVLGDPV